MLKVVKNYFALVVFLSVLITLGCGSNSSNNKEPVDDGGGGKSKVTISGRAEKGMLPETPSEKSLMKILFAPASGNVIISGTVEVYSKTGTPLGSTTTDASGNFSVDIDPGVDYFIKVTSSDGSTVVTSYVESVGNSGVSNLLVNATSSAVVFAMESYLNTTLASSSGGYSGPESLADISNQIESSGSFSDLELSVLTDINAGNSSGFSQATTTMANTVVAVFNKLIWNQGTWNNFVWGQ